MKKKGQKNPPNKCKMKKKPAFGSKNNSTKLQKINKKNIVMNFQNI